jgi:hypothetical protein
MAIVTGTLTDFNLQSLYSASARLVFTASDPGILPGRLLSTRPIVVIPSASGAFEVDLRPTDAIMPLVWYQVRIDWLDSDGGYVGTDFVPWPLFVPSEGGAIGDLLSMPSNPGMVWEGPTPPDNPTPGTWWLQVNPNDPADPRNTGQLYEWSDD